MRPNTGPIPSLKNSCNFYSLTQNARIHKDNHKLVVEGIENFSRSANRCMQDKSITLKISNGQLFAEDEKLPYNRTTKHLFDNIVRYFDIRGLEGLRFFKAAYQFTRTAFVPVKLLLIASLQAFHR